MVHSVFDSYIYSKNQFSDGGKNKKDATHSLIANVAQINDRKIMVTKVTLPLYVVALCIDVFFFLPYDMMVMHKQTHLVLYRPQYRPSGPLHAQNHYIFT